MVYAKSMVIFAVQLYQKNFQNQYICRRCSFRVRLQVRFKINIPLKFPKINCTLRIYWIDYCRIVIRLTDMKLLHFVYMHMLVKVVLGILWSWGARPKSRLHLMYNQLLPDFNPIKQVFAIVTMQVLGKMPISDMNILHWQLLKMHTQLHLIHKIDRVHKVG